MLNPGTMRTELRRRRHDAPSRPWEDLVAREPSERPERLDPSYLTHELRAPLTSIRSALLLLQERLEARLDADDAHVLGLAVKNSERLNGLIDDIMDFARLRSGKLPLRPEPVYPRSLLQEAADGLKSWAVSKGIRLLREADPEPLPRVRADPRRTLQVLTNLVSNALKFTRPGGRVILTARPGRGEHAGTVVFSVKDTGCGIPPQARESIFRAFEQSATGEKLSEGAGLGLTLAKAMVELQGGRIWVESWQGLGSTFRFTVPISPEDLARPVEVYPRPIEYHGLLVSLFQRLNAWLAVLPF